MPIEIALLGCAHPHVPDLLGVLASEPDLRLAAAWDADPSAVPPAIGGAAVGRARTAIGRADAVVICAPVDEQVGHVGMGAAEQGDLDRHPCSVAGCADGG